MVIRKNSNGYTIVFLMVDSATGLGKTNLNPAPTVYYSKNGGNFTLLQSAVQEIGYGYYKVVLDTTHTDIEGALVIYATAPGTIPFDHIYEVSGHDETAETTASKTSTLSSVTDQILNYTQNSQKRNIRI